MSDQELAKVVRVGFEKLCAEFTARVVALGFDRTRKTLWTRSHPHVLDVIHFHHSGSTYGAPISASVDVRIHFALRVLNDPFDGIGLNGISSDDFIAHRPSYHLRFNARSFSQYDRCLGDAIRFVEEQGMPWFSRFAAPETLLHDSSSPLTPEARIRLQAAIETGGDPATIAASRKRFGVS